LGAIVTAIVFVILILLKTLLDLKIAQYLVKYLYWLPLRNYFREKPACISGKWEQTWDSAGSANFQYPNERTSELVLRQFSGYCYAEFVSKGDTYVVFG
jgi:hypothetical protein